MDFGDALKKLKEGFLITRKGWNGKDMHIGLIKPEESNKMTLPYIFMYTAQCDLVPWLASQTDILADDWEAI